MFFDRLADVGANGQWGLFSMTIPGRVGYQVHNCSSFNNYYANIFEVLKLLQTLG